MKKLLTISLVLTFAGASLALAKGGNHPMAGCGLGYVLFGNTDNSRVMQILAATTNGTSANQTFGMTTGTSGCTEDGAVKFVKEAEVYAEVNLDSLRREMAMGQGDTVTSFAYLLGARDAEIPAMVKMFQSNYSSLFPSASTSSAELLASLSDLLSQKNS